jgi:hypothetical protein
MRAVARQRLQNEERLRAVLKARSEAEDFGTACFVLFILVIFAFMGWLCYRGWKNNKMHKKQEVHYVAQSKPTPQSNLPPAEQIYAEIPQVLSKVHTNIRDITGVGGKYGWYD